jgi:hypothetical protein
MIDEPAEGAGGDAGGHDRRGAMNCACQANDRNPSRDRGHARQGPDRSRCHHPNLYPDPSRCHHPSPSPDPSRCHHPNLCPDPSRLSD